MGCRVQGCWVGLTRGGFQGSVQYVTESCGRTQTNLPEMPFKGPHTECLHNSTEKQTNGLVVFFVIPRRIITKLNKAGVVVKLWRLWVH